MRILFTAVVLSLAAGATPALARHYDRGPAPNDENNSYWRDYQDDLSEARRELRSDLRHAHKPSDRREVWAEYRREVADARYDYGKEMREKGYQIGTVLVEDAEN